MSAIHIDFTGDNSNLVSTINDTTSHLEDLAKTMKAFSREGLDVSTAEGQFKALSAAIKSNKELIKTLQEQYNELAQAQEEAAKTGDVEAVRDYGQQLADLGTNIQQVVSETNELEQAQAAFTGQVEKTNAPLKENETFIVRLLGGTKSYNEILKALPEPIRNVVSGLNGMLKAAKAFIATPLGVILAALIVVLKPLFTWFNKTAEGQQKMAQISGYLKGILIGLEGILKKVGRALAEAFGNKGKGLIKGFGEYLKDQTIGRVKSLIDMFGKLGEMIKHVFKGEWKEAAQAGKDADKLLLSAVTGISPENLQKAGQEMKNIGDIAKKNAELSARENKLHRDRTAWLTEEAELDRQIAEARDKMWTGTTAERQAAAVKAEELINKKYEKRKELAQEEYAITHERNQLTESSQEELDHEAQLLAEITRLDAQRLGEMRMFNRLNRTAGRANIAYENKVLNELNAQLFANEEKRIGLIRDNGERTRKQIILNYDKQIEAIRKKRQQWQDANREQFGDETLTDEQEQVLKEEAELAEQERDRAFEDALKADAQRYTEYLKQFTSYEEAKLAITREYAEKIREAEEAGDVYQAASYRRQQQTALSALDANRLLKNANLSMVFSDLGLVLTEPLKEAVDQLRDYTKTDAFRSRSIEDQKSVYEAIEKMSKKLEGIGGLKFSSIGDALQDYNNALAIREKREKTLAEATERLNSAQELVDESAKLSAEDQKKLADNRDKALAKQTKAANKLQEAEADVLETEVAVTDALQNFNNSVAALTNAIEGLSEGKITGLLQAFGSNLSRNVADFFVGTKSRRGQLNNILSSEKYGGNISVFAKEVAKAFKDATSGASGEFKNSNQAAQAGARAIERVFNANGAGDLAKFVVEPMMRKFKSGDLEGIVEGVEVAAENTEKAISAAGDTASMIVTLVIQLLDKLKEQSAIDILTDAMGGFADALENILTHILDFSNISKLWTDGFAKIIDGLVKGLMNMLTLGLLQDQIGKIFEKGYDEEEREGILRSNEALANSINGLKDAIKDNKATVEEATKAYEQAREAESERQKNLLDLINVEGGAYKGGLAGQKSSAGEIYRQISRSQVEQIEALLGRNLGDDKVAGLLNMSPEEWKKVSDYLPAIYSDIIKASSEGFKDISGYIEQMVESAENLEKLQNDWAEKVTGVSWDNFLGNFKSLMKDMNSEAQDFADNFEDMMSDAILDSLVNEQYKEALHDLYLKFADARKATSAGGTSLTAEEKEELARQHRAIAEQAIADRKALIDSGLITDRSGRSQASGSSAFQAMGAEAGNELNGRFAALQMSGAMISEAAQRGLIQLAEVTNLVSVGNNTLYMIYGMHLLEYDSIKNIEEYAKVIKGFGEKLDRIQDNTSRI